MRQEKTAMGIYRVVNHDEQETKDSEQRTRVRVPCSICGRCRRGIVNGVCKSCRWKTKRRCANCGEDISFLDGNAKYCKDCSYILVIRRGNIRRGSLAKRDDVLMRDNYTCVYCGKSVTPNTAHIDHIIPVSRGGDNSLENLATACARCNLSKGARTEEKFRKVIKGR